MKPLSPGCCVAGPIQGIILRINVKIGQVVWVHRNLRQPGNIDIRYRLIHLPCPVGCKSYTIRTRCICLNLFLSHQDTFHIFCYRRKGLLYPPVLKAYKSHTLRKAGKLGTVLGCDMLSFLKGAG